MKWWTAIVTMMVLPALAAGQSLGDAARKERQRRERERKTESPRTLTEEDLARTKGRLANEPDPAPATEGGTAKTGGGATARRDPSSTAAGRSLFAEMDPEATRRREQQEWRNRVARVEARLLNAQRQCQMVEQLEQAVDHMDDADAKKASHARSVRIMAERAQAEREAAQQEYDRVIGEARRSGLFGGPLR